MLNVKYMYCVSLILFGSLFRRESPKDRNSGRAQFVVGGEQISRRAQTGDRFSGLSNTYSDGLLSSDN